MTDSPAVLASAEYGMSPQTQKYMKARAVAMGEEADFGGPVGQACVMQINPNHAIMKRLKAKVDMAGDGQPDDEAAKTAQV